MNKSFFGFYVMKKKSFLNLNSTKLSVVLNQTKRGVVI